MKTLIQLIESIKNSEIFTDNYVALQDAAFEIATKKVEFGQDRHSEPGTPNKFIVDLPEAIEAEGQRYKSLTFVDDSNAIYLNLDLETALECAELDGWFEEYSKINNTILNSVICDNREYIEESGQNAKEFFLLGFDADPGSWDCVFTDCPSWDELDEYHREYRKKALINALSNY